MARPTWFRKKGLPGKSMLSVLQRHNMPSMSKRFGNASRNVFLNAPLAKAQRVLSVPSTLPVLLLRGARLALVSVRADFRADALRLWGCQSFGAAPAPLSRVLALARVLPAGAPPHLPKERHTGHTRG